MTDEEKLSNVKDILNVTDQDSLLSAYLTLAGAEIINWLYSGRNPVDTVPARYEATQIMAVVAGFSMAGAEGQLSHSENGISRQWKHSDMLDYIRSNVIPLAQIY